MSQKFIILDDAIMSALGRIAKSDNPQEVAQEVKDILDKDCAKCKFWLICEESDYLQDKRKNFECANWKSNT